MGKNQLKDEQIRGSRYMIRKDTQIPQICRVIGQKVVEIYQRRGFEEVTEEVFEEYVQIRKQLLEKKVKLR